LFISWYKSEKAKIIFVWDWLSSAMSFPLKHTHRLVASNPRARENVMRTSLEFLTGKPFVKVRPAWLRNPLTNRCLEIDAWNEELKLACEFQGYQHTVFPNCFHKTYDEFERQQQRDQFKAGRLKELGLQLVEVPHTVRADEICSFLADRLQKLNLLWAGSPDELSRISEEMTEDWTKLPIRQTATPVCVDHSSMHPIWYESGQLPWMTPRFASESSSREWLVQHGWLAADDIDLALPGHEHDAGSPESQMRVSGWARPHLTASR
jgi:hypothetical protein